MIFLILPQKCTLLVFIRICLFVLRFYGPISLMGSFRAWLVYLTTLILGRLSPLTVNQYCAHSFDRFLLTNGLLESVDRKE